MTPTRTPYFPQIDSLRALTIITVMVYHINAAWIPGGFASVDVFFAISGYVISRSMLELDASGLRSFVSGFYVRRVLRILPALLVILLATSIITTLFVPVSWLSDANYITASYAFWGFGNYGLLNSGDSYFAPRIDFNPYAHTWSLAVEEQFYLLFPLVFFVWLKFQGQKSVRRHTGTALLVALFVASLVYCAYASKYAPSLAYYLLPSRFWELAAGGLLFQLHANGRRLTGRQPGPQTVQLVIALALYVAAITFSKETAFPYPWGLLAVAGTLLAIDAVTAERAHETRLAAWMRSPVLIWIGRLSYSLYLWHWPIYALFHWTVGMNTWATRIAAVSLTAGLSWCTYTWVENTLRRGALVRSKRRVLVIAGGVASMFVFARAAAYLHARQFQFSRSVTKNFEVWYPEAWFATGQNKSAPCKLVLSIVPFGGGTRETYSRETCDGGKPVTNLFVTGDSHSQAYRTLLSRFAATESFNVHIYFWSPCLPFKLHDPMTVSSSACKTFYDSVISDIRTKHRPGDIVFLPSLRTPRLGDQWGVDADPGVYASPAKPDVTLSRRQAISEAEGLLLPLLRDGVHVVFEGPKPVFPAPAFRCSDWFNRRNPSCASGLTLDKAYLEEFRRPILADMTEFVGRHAGMTLWDPFEVLCPGATCNAIVNGEPLFFDGDHLSGHGNEALYPSFSAFMRELHSSAPSGS